VHVPVPGPDQDVLGDPTRLRQVLMNLFSNAVKYNRVGGSVEVGLQGDAERVAIAVRDTGHGLAPEQVGQLFQPFNRLGAEQRGIEGTGLGLVIAKQLVEAMGGSLEAQSTPGTGSVFTVHLQRAKEGGAEAAPVPTAVPARQAGPDARPFVVLYVEDNPVNVAVMCAALGLRDQVRVEVASDGQSGLDMARELRPDLVLLDMDLPVMDGPTVLHHLKSDPALACIPCVAVSANAMDADIKQALGAGFSDYIVKPFAMQRLLAVLDGFMAARPPAA
jgi:CheY-like chemotaxis protein